MPGPNLARAIAEPERKVVLRQAVVTAAAVGGTVSIKLGNSATAIDGVRRLEQSSVVLDDVVWVLQQGYDLLVIGPVGASAMGHFNSLSLGWGYGGAFFNDRLAISTNGTPAHDAECLTLMGGSSGISFRSRNRPDSQTDGRWVLYNLNDILRTFSGATGLDTFLWQTDRTKNLGMYVTERGYVLDTIHSGQAFQAIGWGSQGISFWVNDSGLAPILQGRFANGDRLFVRNNPNTGYAPIAASGFEVNSTLRAKREVRTLEKGAREKVKQMRPIRFKREHNTRCANCKGQGQISFADYAEHLYGIQRTSTTPDNLLEPVPCPICSAYGTPGLINSPTVDRNEDTDFLSFAAEEVESIVPEAVVYAPTDPADAMSVPRPEGIDIMGLLTVVATAVQEIDERLDALEALPVIMMNKPK